MTITVQDQVATAGDSTLTDEMKAAIAAAEIAMRCDSATHAHYAPN
jgi:hypothetical protein